MVNVKIEDGKLVLTLEGLDKLWAMKSHLAIPLGNVSAVRADAKIAAEKGRTGLKLTGARLGERLIAGSFRQDGKTVFWDVHDAAEGDRARPARRALRAAHRRGRGPGGGGGEDPGGTRQGLTGERCDRQRPGRGGGSSA